jgi:isoamylase
VVDTAQREAIEPGSGRWAQAGDRLTLVDRSLVVLQQPGEPTG